MKRVRFPTLFVLDISSRVIVVRARFVWARVACVPSSSLLLIVYTSSCICFATRIALCVCCSLSTSFVVVWRRYLKDGTQPSQALPGHVVLAVVVARGLSERWWVLVLFTFPVLADLTYLLLMGCVLWCDAEDIVLLVLSTTAFFLNLLFEDCRHQCAQESSGVGLIWFIVHNNGCGSRKCLSMRWRLAVNT